MERMTSLTDVYTQNLHKEFKVRYAVWPIGENYELGDYGDMEGDVFTKMGNIVKEYKIKIEPGSQGAEIDQEFKSAGSVQVTSNVSGSAPGANASVQFNFTNKNAIFFHAAGCIAQPIDNYEEVGRNLLNLLNKKKWQKKYVVVTETLKSGATTILVSKSNNASITIKAKDNAIPDIDFSNINLNLSVVSSKNMSYQAVAQKGMMPLIRLSTFSRKFGHFGPKVWDVKTLI